jgi:hypothetical protein
MEEQFKKEDEIIRKLVSDAGLEEPSPDFKSKLMLAIEEKAASKLQYKPLITLKAWIGVALAFAAVIVIAYIFPSSGWSTRLGLDSITHGTNLSLPEFEISKTFVYGIMFLSLFLFQIPLLKKFVEAKYR